MSIRRILVAASLFLGVFAHAGEAEDIQQLINAKRYSQALARADKFLVGNPKDAQVRFLKGIIQAETGQSSEAIKTFSALAADYPQLPEPHNNLAVLYAQQNQIDKARQSLQMAIQTNPSYAIAHENLGDLYARLASQSYDKALQLENHNPNVKTKLKLVRELFSRAPIAVAKQKGATPRVTNVEPVPAPAKPVTPPPVAKPAPQPPAASAQPAKPAQTDNRDADKQKVVAAIQSWADAWARQNVNGYLAAYDRDFHPPKGQKFNAWAKERRERISAPKSIDVKVSDFKVEFSSDNSAKVRFRQNYRSDRLSSSTGKTMIMQKSGNRWLIREERTGG
ncbi:Tetratricopeptide repeat-containing protein [Formivibrio citricus]|uniref:Tetratricopeptide repeat-containing protein n=1 Tax=Formivibrio citricus TaxID=83765 RepID=A0A1I4ZUZ2_9NEIS|nr:nuclear transport factor 2 family protein [Formivibrio citricus]SFN53883.1 Tetratricopeptide repeat-containing protein [Formivibrio citricus]